MKLPVSKAKGKISNMKNDIVQDAKLGRWKTTTKSRPEPLDADPGREERGVGRSRLNC